MFATLALLVTLSVADVEKLLVAERLAEARSAAIKLASTPSTAAEGHLILGRVLLEQGEYLPAIEGFKKAAEGAPSSALPHVWLARTWAEMCREEGLVCWLIAVPTIRSELEVAIERAPSSSAPRIDQIKFFAHAPTIAGGSLERARAEAIELAKRDPSGGNFALGYLAFQDGRHADAENHFARSSDPEALLFRIWIAQMRNDWSNAFARCEALAKDPAFASRAAYELGRTAAFSGQRLAEGRTNLQSYANRPHSVRMPSRAEALRWLGALEERAGGRDLALRAYEGAVALEPGGEEARRELRRLRSQR